MRDECWLSVIELVKLEAIFSYGRNCFKEFLVIHHSLTGLTSLSHR